ncbi:MAG: hypothetical protein QY325_10100 [Flavobacteriales bacterium]|jgi:hypothetical protein|nr:MAG: hypothetical protein QY325_10100 [Flavobacteriales bacterium]
MSALSRHLVPLKPRPFAERACPKCGSTAVDAVDVAFPGIHVLGDYACRDCGYRFYHDMPVGFAVDYDVAIGKADGTLHNPKDVDGWVHGPLMSGFRAPSDEEVRIERRVIRPCKRVVLLNTLDFLYGHVLLKLWNATYYLEAHPDLGLVLLVPRAFAWLVPKGAAEVWVVDQRLGKAHGWYRSIDRQVKAFLKDYDEVFLGRGYAHPDKTAIDIARYTGVEPFPLEDYATAPKRITFVLREDRLWYRTPLHKLMHRALRRIGLRRLADCFFLRDQQRLAMGALARIRLAVPGVRATIVGLGDPSLVPTGVTDLRTRRIDEQVERAWCSAYAGSQLVVGVHGSNMLLPTALAAGCIEVLPRDRYINLAQDVAVRYNDVMQLFLYRFVDEFATSADVARHAVSMLRDFELFNRNNRVNPPHHAGR